MDIKIGEREIPMLMTVAEMAEIQEEIGCTVGQLRDEVFGIEINFEAEKEEDQIHFGIVEDGKKIRKFAKLIRILGNAGLEEAGKEPDLTDKWILRHMKPGMLMAYVVGVTAIINAAMQIETAEEKQDAPVDEVLEEENRKKEPET